MKFHRYTEEQFRNAIESSTSIRQVLSRLNLKEAGGNYQTVKKTIKYLDLDCSHFTGQSSNKGKKFDRRRPIQDYLSNEYPIQSFKLKKRLFEEGYFEQKCYCCQNTKWNNKQIPLELEHKDGNHFNNELSNLTILCPNCHAQTSTYRGKNITKCGILDSNQ